MPAGARLEPEPQDAIHVQGVPAHAVERVVAREPSRAYRVSRSCDPSATRIVSPRARTDVAWTYPRWFATCSRPRRSR